MSTTPAKAAPTVIFLNPDVILDQSREFRPGPVPTAGTPGGVLYVGNEAAEALKRLIERTSATVALTKDRPPYDAYDQLLMEGVRASPPGGWKIPANHPERAAVVVRWHSDNAHARAIVIDRPGFLPPGMMGITVPEASQITHAVVDQVLAMMERAAATSRDA